MQANRLIRNSITSGAFLAGLVLAAPASAVDWGGVETTDITLFYPGQSSWEYVLTPSDHDGAEKFRGGKDCMGCHEDEETEMGQTVVSGEKVEPNPIAGKPGSLSVDVQTAYDSDRFYVRLSWTDTGFKAPQPESDELLHVNMMLGDGTVPSFNRGGCWATCHADVEGMPHDTPELELTKYLARSRTKVTRSGGGTNYKSDDDLQNLLSDGMFLEYWQTAIADVNAEAEPESGYVLDKRHVDDTASIRAEASLEDGQWTVVLSRPLQASGPGQKALAEGKTYIVGFAIHDGYADGRHHYVSFKRTLTLGGGDGDIVAKKM